MKRGIIGIAGNIVRDQGGTIRYCISHECVSCLEKAELTSFIIPLSAEIPEELLSVCGGVLFPGGGDIAPDWRMHPRGLDAYQIHLARLVMRRKIPYLAICRGIQVMNVAAGGTLIPHIEGHQQMADPKGARTGMHHGIYMEPNSTLSSMFGTARMVNSFHHQCVGKIGDGFRVAARAEDGVIEAIEQEDHPFGIGVQWHPEINYAISSEMEPLFQAFAKAVMEHP